MRLPHCHAVLAPVLCVLLALLAPPARASDGPSASGEVARLYEEAAAATQKYEQGKRAAAGERAKAGRLEGLLTRQRAELALLHADLGRIARAQYRTGGGIPYTAQLLMAEDPDQLMRGQRAAWQADLAVDNAIAKTRRATNRLDRDERTARKAWQQLDRRQTQLASLRSGIERKLEDAQWKLQGEADGQATAGQCRGAVRLDQPSLPTGKDWVTPVARYELSAGFGGSGERWASRHTGQDFAVDIGTPVRSIGAGRVERVSCGGSFGMEVVVRHDGGYYTQYAHLAAVTVDQGERVLPGQWIGQAGTTGNSTGPHLHFEVRLTPQLGSGVDPRRWLEEHGVKL
ncbi:M23 family peptidase [Streptomyces triticagri]|uniref:M23 family peptidase n=1 Tax=Streptomyces triticagri TaxID=2293568 RepID=A0A372LVF5_9ACTN|nr:M23 family metallopeptidase [Streptomyces triticagri]RFU82529.1 M23 family peptidase [Streptomyces triticagri]